MTTQAFEKFRTQVNADQALQTAVAACFSSPPTDTPPPALPPTPLACFLQHVQHKPERLIVVRPNRLLFIPITLQTKDLYAY